MPHSTNRGLPSLALVTFAVGLAGLGVLGLVNGDFALQWQPVPAAWPLRTPLAYLTGATEVMIAIALMAPRLRSSAAHVLLVFALAWVVLLKIPVVVAAPLVEVSWLGLGEISMVLAGSLSLIGTPRCRRAARIVFALALIPVGLSHLVYAKATAGFIPAWIPFKLGWAYFTGAAQIAAGLAVLFDVLAVLAATLEALMLGLFAVLVWAPVVARTPAVRLPWTALLITWVIAATAWVVTSDLALPSDATGESERVRGFASASTNIDEISLTRS
ncbi:MAG TPA: hypothetical protein VGM50_18285 [Gemmatimonadaceae bacterium]